MRVPALVAIPIVALCATTGLALGWVFPLTPSHHRDGEPSQVATASRTNVGKVRESMERLAPEGRITISEDEDRSEPPFSPPAVPNDAASSEGPTLSAKHVHEDDWTSTELANSNRIEERKPAPSASETAALPSVAGPETLAAGPQNKTTAPKANPPKSAKKPNRRPTKEAQKPANHRARPGRDDYSAREKQPTRSIISQLPIVGPVFGLLVP